MNAMSHPPAHVIDLNDTAACRAFDSIVSRMPGATPFHRTAWGRAVESALGHKAHYLQAGSDGVLPLIELR